MTVSLYKQFGTNKGKETSGVWIPIEGDFEEGQRPEFLLARMGGSNKKFDRMVEKKLGPFKQKQRRMGSADIPTEVQERVTLETFVDAVLLGWKNVAGQDGKVLEFNRENAITLMKDLPDLYVVLLSEAQDMKVFQDEIQAADAKN